AGREQRDEDGHHPALRGRSPMRLRFARLGFARLDVARFRFAHLKAFRTAEIAITKAMESAVAVAMPATSTNTSLKASTFASRVSAWVSAAGPCARRRAATCGSEPSRCSDSAARCSRVDTIW